MRSYAPTLLLAAAAALCLFLGDALKADGLYVAAFVFAVSCVILNRD